MASGRFFNAITLVRWLFAVSLVCFHACVLLQHDFFVPIKGHAIVSVFFVLSGMLTYEGFMVHPEASPFYLRRFRKLFPPYALVVVACALGFAAFSSLSLHDYYVSSGFWKYLAANLSFLNFLAPNLPGVFAVGDIRTKALRQIVTATADGANAAYATEEYLANWAKNN